MLAPLFLYRIIRCFSNNFDQTKTMCRFSLINLIRQVGSVLLFDCF